MFAVKSGNDTPAVKLWQPAHSQGLDGSTGRRTMGREITRLELQLQQKKEKRRPPDMMNRRCHTQNLVALLRKPGSALP